MKFFPLSLLFIPILATTFSVNATVNTTVERAQQEKNVAKNTALDEQQLSQQRANYQKINQLLAISNNQVTLNIARDLLVQLKGYPLYVYADYAILKHDKKNLTLAKIATFQRHNPPLALLNNLKQQWLDQQLEQENWDNILANRTQLPNNTAASCAILLAQVKTSAKNTALSAEQQIKWASAVNNLWLTGNNLPNQCSPLLENWAAQGYQTRALTEQRAVLALTQKNFNLITHLANQSQDANLRLWLNNLVAFAPKAKFNEASSPFYIDKLSANNASDKAILLTLFPTFVKNLNDSTFPNSADPFSTFALWAARFQLDTEQINQWKVALIAQLFDSPRADLQQWRDAQLQQLANDNLTERRIRLALREQQNLQPWLNLLSAAAQQKEEWQYWSAQTLHKQGKHAEAKKILQNLTALRSFYGLLAAQELGIDYQPQMDSVQIEPSMLADENTQSALKRITELRFWQDTATVNQEWNQLLTRANFEQKLQLASYAIAQQWFDLAVEATIQAKAWSYLSLRLPNAYPNWFDIHLKDKKIDRTFAMAIARQESAWKPYVTSSANAFGLMQLLASTAKQTATQFGLPYHNQKQLFDPFDNIMLGTAHLQQLYEKYGDNRILIAAAYNAGAARVDSWLTKSAGKLSMAEFVASIPFYETRGYVQNVLAYAAYYQLLQNKKVQKFSPAEYNRTY